MKILNAKIAPCTAIIGDVHQCNGMLKKMIQVCQEAGVKNFIFLGDILDRGEDPVGTVETLLSIKDISTFLVGNHDWKYLRYYYGRGVSLTEEQSRIVETFKNRGEMFKDFCDLFYQEWVALIDSEQKVLLSHACGCRPQHLYEKHNRHETGKADYARLLYGITNGDTEDGKPVRLNVSKNVDDTLEGWWYFYGHHHAYTLHSQEPSLNMFCIDFRAGQPDGRLAAWVVEDNVRNGKLLVINQSLEAAWNCDTAPTPVPLV